MKTYAHRKITLLATWLVAAAAPAFLGAQAPHLPLQRLVPTTPATTDQELGFSVAVSDHYIASGAPKENFAAKGKPSVATAGAVHVFRANGTFLKRIYSPTPQIDARFGMAIAVDATTLYVSAQFEDTTVTDTGAIYAINIATGALLWKYSNPALPVIGRTIAVSGPHLVVGCPNAPSLDGMKTNAGRVLQLNTATGALVASYEMLAPEDSGYLGERVAVEGSLLVAASQFATSQAHANAGRVAVFDLDARAFIGELTDPDAAASAGFGLSIAIRGNVAAVVRGASPGRVLLFNVRERNLLRTVIHPSGLAMGNAVAIHGDTLAVSGNFQGAPIHLFDRHTGALTGAIDHLHGFGDYAFGTCLASHHNTIVVGANLWADQGVATGAVFVSRAARSTLPGLTVLARIGDYAPSAGGPAYASFSDPTFSGQDVSWKGLLNSGPANRRKGGWSRINGQTDGPFRQGINLGAGGVIGDIVAPYSAGGGSQFHLRTAAPVRNAVWGDDGFTVTRYYQEGEVFTASGLVASKLIALSGGSLPTVQTLAKVGVAGVTTTNDSMVAQWDVGTSTMQVLAREGGESPLTGRSIGQFAPRLAQTLNQVFLSASLQGGTAADNQLLYLTDKTGTLIKIAQRGDPAPGCNGALYGQFIGEQNGNGSTTVLLFRATLTGSPVAENEALFSPYTLAGLNLMVRKGAPAPGVQGKVGAVTFSRFIRTFEPTLSVSTMFHAAVKGTGITAANDEAVWHFNGFTGDKEVLMREGDPAPGCGGARVGVFQRMELDTNGRYYILASLTGSATGADQALFVGHLGGSHRATRRPCLVLRKGMQVNRFGSQQIKSISFSPRSVNAQGLGAPDVCRQITSGGLLFTLTYTDNSTDLVSGWPDNVAP